MEEARWRKVREIFEAALERPTVERAAFLDTVCAGDLRLREEVEQLLRDDKVAEAEEFLDDPGSQVRVLRDVVRGGDDASEAHEGEGRTEETENSPGQERLDSGPPTIPGYRLLREITRGGQGVVYEALQESTKRKVVIKLLRGLHRDDHAAKKRFEREVDIAAQLKHPNIVTVFDSGQTSSGERFLSMEYIRGVPLDEYVRGHQLQLPAALALFHKVCQAIQYAHQRGVIHRDLKPSNILVGADGEPKVLDFGMAKILAADIETVITQTADLFGTLPYLSPEQAQPGSMEVDTRTDVYSLGVILYQLLTGQHPYPVAGAVAQVIGNIIATPPRPLRQSWSPDSGILRPRRRRSPPGECPIDNEINTIVMKCLAKGPERRYQSAGELARDIQHYLAGQPIEARRDSLWYLLRKEVRRRRVPLTAVAALVLLLIASSGLALRGFAEALSKREEARRARQSEEVREFLAWFAAAKANEETQDLPRYQGIMKGICERLRAQTATPLDCEGFVRGNFDARLEGRPLVAAGDPAAITFSLSTEALWSDLTDGLGLRFTPHLLMDGSVVQSPRCPDGGISWIPDWRPPKALWYEIGISGCFAAPDGTGPHHVSGTIDVEIIKLPRKDYGHWPVEARDLTQPCEPIPDAHVVLQVPALRFTVVKALPPAYPPRITDEAEALRIRSGFRIEQLVIAREQEPGRPAALIVDLSFPAPKVTLACELMVSSEHGGWKEVIELVSLGGGIGGRHRSGEPNAPDVVYSSSTTGGEKWFHVDVSLPLDRGIGRWVEDGDEIGVALIASEPVAQGDPEVAAYLDLDYRRSIVARIATSVSSSPEEGR